MRRTHLGDLQHAIMQILWRHRQATVAEVHAELLEDRGLAPTTIATMLTKMERKGVVAHTREGRRYVYRPTVSESEVRRSMISEITERLFDGSATALVSHLISEHEIDPEELQALREQIERATTAEPKSRLTSRATSRATSREFKQADTGGPESGGGAEAHHQED